MTNFGFNILLEIFNKNNVADSDAICKKFIKEPAEYKETIEKLKKENYIDEKLKLTKNGEEFVKNHKIDNAIILAAGTCSRFVPLNLEIPKGLLPVNGEVLIERQIRQLHEVGINDIVIVVGYMKEKFEYLTEKYDVTLVETKDYLTRNNHASVWAARKYLKNTVITNSDLYFSENIFQSHAFDSYYTCVYKSGNTSERGIQTDSDDRILSTFYGDRCYDVWVTLGHAYFSERFSKKFIEILTKIYDEPSTINKFWADIQDDNLDELYMYSKRCSEDQIVEFDSFEELKAFDRSYVFDSRCNLLKKIATEMKVKESDILNIETLRSIKPSLFSFDCNGEHYVVDYKYDGSDLVTVHGKQYQTIRVIDGAAIYESKFELPKENKFDAENELEEIFKLTDDFCNYHERALPLCAAENVISKFANMPLVMGFQERYIMNNTYSFNMADNFIGCEKLYPFYERLSKACERIFCAKYSDPRPFTGMNCIDMVLKTVTKPGDKMFILSSQHGGHASVRPVAERLGIEVIDAPYDLSHFDLDYDEVNKMVKEENIKFILLAPSDIIKPLEITKIDTSNCILLYDCSQLMGLIAAGLIENPLKTMRNIIMFGGTHKTFPGPASGLILTNDKYLHDMMEKTINPLYLRHSQMHQKISLLFALIEFEKFGTEYMKHMVHCSRYLAEKLAKLGFDVVKPADEYSYTHQVFIRCSKETMDQIYENAYKFEVTLNKKNKDLFSGYGIRLGTQEIARYNWNDSDLDNISEIIKMLTDKVVDGEKLNELKSKLSSKTINYTFDENEIEGFRKLLFV